MKTLILTLIFLAFNYTYSQNLEGIFKNHIQPSSSNEELKEGLKQIEELCSKTPQDKCDKAKASALYLIANNYYEVVYKLISVDKTLIKPIKDKADSFYNKAMDLYPISKFHTSQQRILQEHKLLLEN